MVKHKNKLKYSFYNQLSFKDNDNAIYKKMKYWQKKEKDIGIKPKNMLL